MRRRHGVHFVLVVSLCALVAAATGTAAAGCPATIPDGFGPFGRGSPPMRASIGKGHVLTGVVLSSLSCKPIRGARVELWQANAKGKYVRATSGTVLTDRSGRFRFEGPYPTAYEGAPPHIHLRVVASGHEVLLSRYVPARGARQRLGPARAGPAGGLGAVHSGETMRTRPRTASTAATATSKAPHAIAATDHARPNPPAASGHAYDTSPR